MNKACHSDLLHLSLGKLEKNITFSVCALGDKILLKYKGRVITVRETPVLNLWQWLTVNFTHEHIIRNSQIYN